MMHGRLSVRVAATVAGLLVASGGSAATVRAGAELARNGSFESFTGGTAPNWRLNGSAQFSSVPGVRPQTRAVVLELASEERSANISQGVTGLSIPAGTMLELSAYYSSVQ